MAEDGTETRSSTLLTKLLRSLKLKGLSETPTASELMEALRTYFGKKGGVPLLVVPHKLLVQSYLVGGPVGDKHPAVSVQNIWSLCFVPPVYLIFRWVFDRVPKATVF